MRHDTSQAALLLRPPGRMTVGLVLAALLGLALSAKLLRDTHEAAVAAVAVRSNAVLTGLRHLDIPFLRGEIAARTAREPETLVLAVIHQHGPERLLPDTTNPADLVRLRRLRAGATAYLWLSGGPALVQAVDVAGGLPPAEIDMRDVELYVGRRLPTALEVAALSSLLLGWAAFAAIAAALSWHRRCYRQRLAAINAHLTRIGEGRLDLLDAPRRDAAEIRALTRHVNTMIRGLRSRITTLHALAEISAHELRTQFTRMGLGLRRLDRAVTDEALRAEISQLRGDLGNLMGLHDGLVSLAETSADLHDVSRFRVFDLAELLEDVLDDHADDLMQNGRKLESAVAGPVPVLGETLLVRRLFENLFDNVRKYAPEGAAVSVLLEADREEFTAIVANSGCFRRDIRERAFDIGERGNGAEDTGGLGFGLSLVRAIALKHGWRVAIRPSEEMAAVEVRGRVWT